MHSSMRYAFVACRYSSAISAGSRSPRTSRVASAIANLISVPFMSNVANFGWVSNAICPPNILRSSIVDETWDGTSRLKAHEKCRRLSTILVFCKECQQFALYDSEPSDAAVEPVETCPVTRCSPHTGLYPHEV